MSKIDYKVHSLLNGGNSHYTGAIVCVDGTNLMQTGRLLDRYTFIEISDCHGKVRIHKDPNLPMKDFIDKLDTLEMEISFFKQYLIDKLAQNGEK